MSSRGTVSLAVDLPFLVFYKFTFLARGDQAGDEPVRVEIVSGKDQRVVNVPASEPEEYSVLLRMRKGERKIDLFVNDYYVAGKEDRNFYLFSVKSRRDSRRVCHRQLHPIYLLVIDA